MGGSSNSKTDETTNVDNRQFAVQDGMGGFAGGDQTFNVLDGGAIKSAERTTGRSLALVDSGVKDAGRTTRAAIDSNTDVSKSAFDTVRRTVGDSLSLVDRSTSDAIASSDAANRRSFDFGRDALDFGGDAMQSVTRTSEDAMKTVRESGRDAFDFGNRMASEMTGVTRQAFQQTQDAFRGVQQLASNVVRGDSGEVADTAKSALYVAGGLGGVVLLVFMMGRK